MNSAESISILVVDDDHKFRTRLAQALEDRGLEVFTASNVAEAISVAQTNCPELALIDLRMPGESGLTLVQALKEIDPETRIVVLTGYASVATAVEAMRLGAVHYLPKPADADEILQAFGVKEGRFTEAEEETSTPSLARVEWEHIQRVLVDCNGNISEAARRLKIHRRSLQRKLQKYPPTG